MLDFPPNWTFALQFLGFFALLYFLDRYLFQPYSDVLERREVGTHGSLQSADSDRRIAAEVKGKVDSALAEARVEAHVQADRLRKQAQVEEAGILDAAKRAATSHLEELRRALDTEVTSARSSLAGEARNLADAMVSAVLNGKV